MIEPQQPSDGQRQVDAAVRQHQIDLAAAQARTPGDWFDIYDSIVVHAAKTTMEQNGESGLAAERLRDRDTQAKRVRADFEAHGLPLAEDIEIEGGPQIVYDQHGIPQVVGWPNGHWIRFHWPDGSQLEFRGYKALIAFAFIQWWIPFHLQFQALSDPTKQAAPKTRIVNPGEADWNSYMQAKRKELGNS